jgi:vacuolar protein sorting-associated protein 13A/C
MKNQGFVDSIIAKIINNFQVTVKNVHIRYEDNVSVAGVSRACPITIRRPHERTLTAFPHLASFLSGNYSVGIYRHLSRWEMGKGLHSLNCWGNPQSKPSCLARMSLIGPTKLAELHSLAVYFNTDSESIAKMAPQESADKFRSLVRLFHPHRAYSDAAPRLSPTMGTHPNTSSS